MSGPVALATDAGSVWFAHGFEDRYAELEARHRGMVPSEGGASDEGVPTDDGGAENRGVSETGGASQKGGAS